MKKIFGLLTSAMIGLAALSPAVADTVTLNDGTVHEGEIIKETDSYLYLRITIGSISTDKLVEKQNIKQIERGPVASLEDSIHDKLDQKNHVPMDIAPGTEKIAFISLEDTVGEFMNAKALERSVEILGELPENERPDTVVLVINSGGGALSEIQPLMDVITEDISPNYRTVAWIKSAISAAAMTAWVVPEIYFETKGNFGACTGFFGASGVQIDGRMLQEVLKQMEDASFHAGYNPDIMRAMQISGPDYPTTLSADIDEHDNVIWHRSDDEDAEPQGKYLVSKHDEILTFDSKQAEFFKFSKGTADTKYQLAELMGCQEWVEVGYEADEYMVGFRESVQDAKNRVAELQRQLDAALANAGAGRPDCARWVGKARNLVGQIRSTVEGTSLMKYTQYQDEFFEIMNDVIRDLQRDCAEKKKKPVRRRR